MPRASRLLELMQILRRRRTPVSGQELSKALGISIRTLYRDIALLQEQGAEIQGEPGLGYVLRPGFTLPPMMFSVEEIEAVVLGARWVAARGDSRLRTAAEDVVAKIRAVLPTAMRDQVDDVMLTVPVLEAPATVDLSVIREAIRAERKVTLTYRNEAGAATRRTVWPLVIGFFDRVMVLAAWCELREDFRAFRVDRIASAEPSDARYPGRRHTLVEEWRKRQKKPATARN
ncbi:YafY family transcriptional regulator [Corallococcus macrosporus]|uniref:YafY family transcriptional regulator n=1 Tax=Corallococcus macrosporus TaxID=35 RepID=A0ABS3DD94_9BACT|nr:YafY family protein [Corallococcus macrosporus]MBN8228385.1 YafY family transcriptional regulator [Corallococcus macrosporus]